MTFFLTVITICTIVGVLVAIVVAIVVCAIAIVCGRKHCKCKRDSKDPEYVAIIIQWMLSFFNLRKITADNIESVPETPREEQSDSTVTFTTGHSESRPLMDEARKEKETGDGGSKFVSSQTGSHPSTDVVRVNTDTQDATDGPITITSFDVSPPR